MKGRPHWSSSFVIVDLSCEGAEGSKMLPQQTCILQTPLEGTAYGPTGLFSFNRPMSIACTQNCPADDEILTNIFGREDYVRQLFDDFSGGFCNPFNS